MRAAVAFQRTEKWTLEMVAANRFRDQCVFVSEALHALKLRAKLLRFRADQRQENAMRFMRPQPVDCMPQRVQREIGALEISTRETIHLYVEKCWAVHFGAAVHTARELLTIEDMRRVRTFDRGQNLRLPEKSALDGSGARREDGKMSVQIDIEYLGGLRTQATHGPSKNTLLTDAPVDNHGKGEAFSPTDLCATSLGTCMLTIMGIYAERHGIDLRGATVRVEKEMVTTPVRRIGKLATEIRVSLAQDHPQREALERAALTCPVHQSLHPDVEKPVTFVWTGATA